MELLNPQLSPKPPMAIDFQSHHFQQKMLEQKCHEEMQVVLKTQYKKTIKVPLSALRRTAWAMCCSMLQGMASKLIFKFLVFTIMLSNMPFRVTRRYFISGNDIQN
nr:unnamed protein product [Callosobruchus analis]